MADISSAILPVVGSVTFKDAAARQSIADIQNNYEPKIDSADYRYFSNCNAENSTVVVRPSPSPYDNPELKVGGYSIGDKIVLKRFAYNRNAKNGLFLSPDEFSKEKAWNDCQYYPIALAYMNYPNDMRKLFLSNGNYLDDYSVTVQLVDDVWLNNYFDWSETQSEPTSYEGPVWQIVSVDTNKMINTLFNTPTINYDWSSKYDEDFPDGFRKNAGTASKGENWPFKDENRSIDDFQPGDKLIFPCLNRTPVGGVWLSFYDGYIPVTLDGATGSIDEWHNNNPFDVGEPIELMYVNRTLTGIRLPSSSYVYTSGCFVVVNRLNGNDYATKQYVDSSFQANDAMLYKGTIGFSGADVTALPATHSQGWTYIVATAGTYAGQVCEVGDMIICKTDGTSVNDAHWNVVQTNVNGAVTGPGSSTDAHVATFNGTTGKIIKDSGFTIASDVPSGAVFTDTHRPIAVNGTAALGNNDTVVNFVAGSNVTITNGGNGEITFAADPPTFTQVTGKPTENQTPSFGSTFTIQQVNQSTTGQVSVTDRTVTIPNAVATTSSAGLMSSTDKTSLNTISSALSCSASDNGKVLSVVDGSPAWVELASANGQSF